MQFMSDVHDHEPDAFDHLLGDVEAMPRAGNPDIEVTVAVLCPRPPWHASPRA